VERAHPILSLRALREALTKSESVKLGKFEFVLLVNDQPIRRLSGRFRSSFLKVR
jgi:hypothetical protein